MIVKCPNCGSTFNVDEDLVNPEGTKSRCSVCEHVFVIQPEAPVDAPGEAPDEDLIPGMEAEDDEVPGDDDGFDAGGDDLGFDIDSGSSKKKKKKKKSGGKGRKGLFIALGLVFVLLAGGGAGVYFFAPQLLPFGGSETPDKPAEQPVPDQGVENIVLKDVRQYYVDNDKLGRVFVVQGQAVNKFDTPKELIRIEAKLLDETDAVLDTKSLLAGNSLTLYQLQIFDEPDFDRALNDKAGIATRNTNLAPGAETPFMLVFFKPADTVREFEVRVVEVKDPPKP